MYYLTKMKNTKGAVSNRTHSEIHTSKMSKTLSSTDVFTEQVAFSAHFLLPAIEQWTSIPWESLFLQKDRRYITSDQNLEWNVRDSYLDCCQNHTLRLYTLPT